MGLLDGLKKAFTSAVNELNANYSKDDDFLKAVCASCALIANADGNIEDSERKAAIDVLTGHEQFSKLYTTAQVSAMLNHSLDQSKTTTGKQELSRALMRVLEKPDSVQMAEDVYAVAKDVASVGDIGPEEEVVLGKIAKLLRVDTSKFLF